MGKDWDKALPSVEVWKRCLRVLKPGAFVFVLCAPRQDVLSRMMIALEDAGFDTSFTSLYWTTAQGFPKAQKLNYIVINIVQNPALIKQDMESVIKMLSISESNEWRFITHLKSTHIDPMLVSYVEQQIGFLNDIIQITISQEKSNGSVKPATTMKKLEKPRNNEPFIICPKPSKKEKSAGCENLEAKETERTNICYKCTKCNKYMISAKPNNRCECAEPNWVRPIHKNNHPTVKPMKLMSYLITMGSREGDLVVDPFMGSGTTGCAAVKLNRNFIGMELSEEYAEIGKARIDYWEDTANASIHKKR